MYFDHNVEAMMDNVYHLAKVMSGASILELGTNHYNHQDFSRNKIHVL
jgi:hypothetical protein